MPPLTTSRAEINVARLPEEAQHELMDFYEFLVFKYQSEDVMQQEKEASSEPLSKWAKIAQRVEHDPVHLAGYSEQLKHDIHEFRTNFEFHHDQ